MQSSKLTTAHFLARGTKVFSVTHTRTHQLEHEITVLRRREIDSNEFISIQHLLMILKVVMGRIMGMTTLVFLEP